MEWEMGDKRQDLLSVQIADRDGGIVSTIDVAH